jgi:type I restriction enzyme S subunit
LRSVNILRPLLDLQKLYNEKVISLLYQIRNNESQNQKLTELRDWLLPMLMNGQLKVNEGE